MRNGRKTFFLVVAVILSAGEGFAQGHQHGTAAMADGTFNPSLISDPRGRFYLAYIARANGVSNVMLRDSADGRTFSQPVRVNDVDGDAAVRNENPPKIAIATNGNLYVCWANEHERWKGNIRFARSTDGGKTFSSAMTLNSDADGAPKGHAFQSLAVDQRGKIYIAWIDERNKRETDRGAEIWLSVSEDQGKTFSRNRRILSDVCECCRTSIQIDSKGRLYLSYRTVPATGLMYRDIIVARSADGGRSFQKTVVSRDHWDINACPVAGPSLCIDRQDRIDVLWFTGGDDHPGLYYASSSDHGLSYSPRQVIDPDLKFGKHAQAITRSDGRLLITWEDQVEKPVIFWGILDPGKGLLYKSAARPQLSYPAIAADAKTVVVGGLQGSNEIRLEAESIQ